jgi:hypothetical protein
MTIQIVTTTDTPQYDQTSTLEGTTFLLSFWYSQREACWYLSLADQSGVDIYNGVKLICANFLFTKCVDPRRPAGDFFCFDQTGANTPPGLEDLVPNAGRCVLTYWTSDLVEAFRSGDTQYLQQFLTSLASNTQASSASTYGQE